MISFIIIGKNEGWKLKRSLQSVFDSIEFNELKSFEVIYVDSNSSDDSVKVASEFENIKIYKITGRTNAAVARNIGAKNASGNVLFFIDGDMELIKESLNIVYNESNGIVKDFISGNWVNYHYDDNWNLIKKNIARDETIDKIEYTTGGLFLIRREIWFRFKGMKTKLNRSQDLDFGLRLAKKGLFLFRKKEVIAIHHSIPHNDKKRMWRLFFSGARFYRIVLLRDNILNKFQWMLFLKGNYTFFLLGLIIIISLFENSYLPLLIYPGLILGRSILRGEKTIELIIRNLIFFTSYEIGLFFAIFFFWPRSIDEKYIKISKTDLN